MSKAARLFLFFVLSLVAQAAFASSSIVGFVTVKGPDAPVGPIANAFVMVADPAFPKQTLAVGQTNAQGFYSITGLAAGTYQVSFTTPGFLQGILTSFTIANGQTDQINAQLVPSLTGTEVAKNNVKDETAYTIHNPNNFAVHFTWTLPQHHATGTGIALHGDTVIDPNQWPHSENISLFVDGSQVQKVTTTVVAPPIVLGNLTGYVKSASGLALGGVQVSLADSSNNPIGSTFTLSDGSYVFTNEPAGTYTLSYSLAGYVSASQSVSLPAGGGQAPTISLAPIPAPPTATLNITVVSDSGPQPNAGVTVAYSNGTQVTGNTDGNGFFSFTGQLTGVAATITATANDGSGRTATASTSGLVAGVNAVTLTLPPIPKGSISGVVTDAANAGTGLGQVMVVVLDANNNAVASATTAADGSYSIIGLKPATYSMTFSLRNYQTDAFGGVFVVSGQNATESVALTSTLAAVSVTVTDAGTGNPVPATTVTINYADGSTAGPLTTDSNGFVTFSGQESNVGATLTAAVQDATGRTASQSIPAGFAPGPNAVSIQMPTLLATFSGVVTDAATGLPISGASLLVTDVVSSATYSATSAADGTYSMTVNAGSKFTFTATANGYQSFATGAPVVNPGQTITQNVALVPVPTTGTVSGVVSSTLLGAPIAGANVVVTDITTLKTYSAKTASDGSYTITGVLPAKIDVTITAGGFQNFDSGPGLNVIAGQNLIFNARLTPVSLASVTVTVRDGGTGQLIPFASVQLAYADHTVVSGITDSSGNAAFSGQETGVAVQISAITPDKRTGSTSVAGGFVGGASSFTVVIPPSGSSGGTLAGVVTDASNGHPIAGATVSIFNGPTRVNSGVSGLDGSYVVPNLPVGNYNLFVTAPNYQNFTGPLFSVQAGQTTVQNVAMIPIATGFGTINGTITDASTKQPINGATVTARLGSSNFTAMTGLFGNYSISGLAPGTYAVMASATGYQNSTLTMAVTLAAGQNATVNGALTPSAGGLATVLVQVTDANTGTAAIGASVIIGYTDGTNVGPIASDANGNATFTNQEIGVGATVRAVAGDKSGRTGSVSAGPFIPGTNNVSVTIPASSSGQTGTVTGTVLDGASGIPIVGASIQLDDLNTGNNVASATTDKGGNFSVSVVAGNYLAVYGAMGYPSISRSQNVPAVQTTNVGQIFLFQKPGISNVTVQVIDGNTSQPASGVSVTISYLPAVSGVPTLLTDANGSVSFGNQPPQTYAVVSATAPDGRTANVVYPGGFPSGSPTVTLTLPATTTGSITGVVVDKLTQQPLPGVTVSAAEQNGTVDATATSGKDGSYSLTGLTQSDYNVTFSLTGYVSQTVAAKTGTTSSVALLAVTAPTANVTVTVVDNLGKAQAGANVTISYADGTPSVTGTTAIDGTVSFTAQPAGTAATIAASTGTNYSGSLTTTFTPGSNNVTLTVIPLPGNIFGTVSDSVTGNALPGVTVTILDWNGKQVDLQTTLTNGTYKTPDLVPGTYTVTFSLTNYLPLTLTVPVAAGQRTTQNAALTVDPHSATVNVAVLDVSGSPVANASVGISYVDGTSSGGVFTDARGNATLTNQEIKVGATITATFKGPNGPITATQSIPNGFASGSNSFTLQFPSTGSVQGVVTDSATGVGIAGVAVSVTDLSNQVVAQTTTAADGSYSIAGLAPGQDLINFTANGYNGTASKLPVSASVVRTINMAMTAIPPTGSLSGNVTGSGGTAVSGSLVTVLDANNNPVATATTDASGNYAINGLLLSTYTVTFSATGYQDNTVPGVVITAGNTTTQNATLTPTANPMDGIVNLTVSDGSTGIGIAGAVVTITFSDGTPDLTMITDGNGFAQFTGVKVGVAATITTQLVDPNSGQVIKSGTAAVPSGFVSGANPFSISM